MCYYEQVDVKKYEATIVSFIPEKSLQQTNVSTYLSLKKDKLAI